jgi:acyl dehydratase
VRPGDVLRITREVVDISRSRSKPDRGVLTMRMTVTNQEGAVVMAFTNLIQMPTRPDIDSQAPLAATGR